MNLDVVQVVMVLVGLFFAFLVIMQTHGSSIAWNTLEKGIQTLQSHLDGLGRSIEDLSALAQAPLSGPSSNSSGLMSSASMPQNRGGKKPPLKPSRVSEFRTQLAVCEAAGVMMPAAVQKWSDGLGPANDTQGKGLANAAAVKESDQVFFKNAEKILKTLLAICDEEKDPAHADMRIQGALEALRKLAELDFIEPLEGKPFHERFHETNEKPRVSDGRFPSGSIATVCRRGLLRKDKNEVILSAEVIVYR